MNLQSRKAELLKASIEAIGQVEGQLDLVKDSLLEGVAPHDDLPGSC